VLPTWLSPFQLIESGTKPSLAIPFELRDNRGTKAIWSFPVIKLSTLLIVLGGHLAATTVKWSKVSGRHTVPVVYQHAKAGKLGVTMYAKLVAPVSSSSSLQACTSR
jgi:hypothetical protein